MQRLVTHTASTRRITETVTETALRDIVHVRSIDDSELLPGRRVSRLDALVFIPALIARIVITEPSRSIEEEVIASRAGCLEYTVRHSFLGDPVLGTLFAAEEFGRGADGSAGSAGSAGAL